MFLQDTPRRQGPGCTLPRPLLKTVLAASLSEGCDSVSLWGKKSRPVSIYYEKSIPQGQSSFSVLQPTVCAGIVMRPLPIVIKDAKFLNKTSANQIQEFQRQYGKIFANFKSIYLSTKQFHFQSSFLPNIENIHLCTCKHKCVNNVNCSSIWNSINQGKKSVFINPQSVNYGAFRLQNLMWSLYMSTDNPKIFKTLLSVAQSHLCSKSSIAFMSKYLHKFIKGKVES